jgi:hypothetical protein
VADRMFIIDGDDLGYADYAELYETAIEPDLCEDPGPHLRPIVVQEWTTRTGRQLLPLAADVVERICEQVGDDVGEVADDWHATVQSDDAVTAAAEQLPAALARHVTFFLGDRRVADHTISWDADGRPLWDGTPIYGKRPADG